MIEIFTDGASSGNPGPGGYGVILRSGNHYKELSGGLRKTTNLNNSCQPFKLIPLISKRSKRP